MPILFFWARIVVRIAVFLTVIGVFASSFVMAGSRALAAMFTPGYLEIAYMVEKSSGDDWDIVLMDVGRRLSVPIVHTPANERYPAWSPDGTRLIYHANNDNTYDLYMWDSQTARTHRLYHPDMFSTADEAMAAWSPDGTRLLFHANVSGTFHVFISDAEGYGPHAVLPAGQESLYPDWAPDGTQIAFGTNAGLFILDTNETFHLSDSVQNEINKHILVEGANMGWYPAWSPDGEQIAFVGGGNGADDIYVINVDGTGLRNLTETPTIIETEPAWLPDGRVIFVANWRWGNGLYIMDADGRNVTMLTDHFNQEQAPAVRPITQ